jgi:hypothetical protein
LHHVVYLACNVNLRCWLVDWRYWRLDSAGCEKEHACANGEANEEGKNEVHQAMVLKG